MELDKVMSFFSDKCQTSLQFKFKIKISIANVGIVPPKVGTSTENKTTSKVPENTGSFLLCTK